MSEYITTCSVEAWRLEPWSCARWLTRAVFLGCVHVVSVNLHDCVFVHVNPGRVEGMCVEVLRYGRVDQPCDGRALCCCHVPRNNFEVWAACGPVMFATACSE